MLGGEVILDYKGVQIEVAIEGARGGLGGVDSLAIRLGLAVEG
jgi:hypothetical protein